MRSDFRTIAAGLALLAGTLAASGAEGDSKLYAVRAGSSVVACGGLAGRCEAWTLDGTLSIAPSELLNGVEIVATDLYLTPPGGARSSFPVAEDLPLTGLSGELVGGHAELVGENDLGQRAELRIVDLERPGGESLALSGSYDEGCCDRFVLELGNVVLDPTPTRTTMLLDGDRADRFEAFVLWHDGDHTTETRVAAPLRDGDGSGRFWFFSPDNPEIFVKVLPACFPPFDRIWVFATGLTDLAANLTIVDGANGGQRVYGNSGGGEAFPAVTDTNAFPCLDSLGDG